MIQRDEKSPTNFEVFEYEGAHYTIPLDSELANTSYDDCYKLFKKDLDVLREKTKLNHAPPSLFFEELKAERARNARRMMMMMNGGLIDQQLHHFDSDGFDIPVKTTLDLQRIASHKARNLVNSSRSLKSPNEIMKFAQLRKSSSRLSQYSNNHARPQSAGSRMVFPTATTTSDDPSKKERVQRVRTISPCSRSVDRLYEESDRLQARRKIDAPRRSAPHSLHISATANVIRKVAWDNHN